MKPDCVPAVTPERIFSDRAPRMVIDLRSPSEFAEDHIPGAVNLPLFDDDDRRVIGTLYRWSGPDEAFREASSRTRDRIEDFVAQAARLLGRELPDLDLPDAVGERTRAGIADMEERLSLMPLEAEDPVVLHCWRGGLRSRSIVAFLYELGWENVAGLEGGYKGYRAAVRDHIAAWEAPPSFCLRGLTGVGKTLVLRELEALRPGWTIDLEGLAAHRSSILGAVGLAPVSQRRFESLLAQRLHAGFPGPVVYEGESRKVGDIILPERIWRSMEAALDLELVAPVERRVQVLVEDYLADDSNRGQLEERLPFIEKRLGARKWNGALVELLRGGREEELVRILLERYYDPLYRHSENHNNGGGRDYARSFDTSDPRACAREIAAFIEEQPKCPHAP